MSDKKKILIIDDEQDLCILLKDYLDRKNYNVFLAHTLKEGQSLVNELCPDVLFLDNNLPDGVGWNIAPSVTINCPSTHIVFISAFHPMLPKMPPNTKFLILEKPFSLVDLDKRLIELTK